MIIIMVMIIEQEALVVSHIFAAAMVTKIGIVLFKTRRNGIHFLIWRFPIPD